MDSSELVRSADRDPETTAPPPTANPSHSHRIPGLDGLRAIAIGAVLLFHADFYWARGGYLGVDLFFVLSGFLITGLLAGEIGQSGRLDTRRFYWRRAKRLLPAVWLMMACVTAAAAVLAPDALPRLRGDAWASLVYLTNWELLSVHVSYFDATGRQPLLQHLWSLAIEEQFYIAWAIAVPFGLKSVGRRALALVAVLLALASAAWMAVLAAKMGYPGQGDPSRLYFGTDTHGFALLLGAALGLAWQPGRASRTLKPAARTFGMLAGLLALAVLVTLFARLGEESALLYPWGLLTADLAAVVLILTASHPGLAFGRWLDSQPLRWIGHRSYGIYLWHWPIFMLTRPGIDLRALDANTVLALRLALTVSIAALSYRYVEMPIRGGVLERMRSEWRLASTRHRVARRATALAMAVLLSFSASVVVLWKAPTHAEPARDVRDALHLDVPPAEPTYMPIARAKVPAAPALAPMPVEVPVDAVQPDLSLVEPQDPDLPKVQTYTGKDLTAVGDSVLLGSSQLLEVTLQGTDVHAVVGSQAADILTEVKSLRDAKQLRAAVILHLGTNGYVYEDQLRQILSALKDCQRVVLVNTHVPRRWMEANNELIDKVAPDYPNVVVARWSDVSEGQPDYFVSDGVHLTDRGQRAFIANIMRVGHLAPDAGKLASKASIDPGKDYATGAGDSSATLVLAARPAVPDKYWLKMALCETDAKWNNPAAHAGGLAIAQDDWTGWGGAEFAKTPAEATQAQQIEIANRISTQGWTRPDGSQVKPIGFVRWRCVAALPPPAAHPGDDSSLVYTPDSVIAQTFHLGERGDVVHDLQVMIGAPHDGIYSKATHRRHLAYLKKNGLPEDRAGAE